MLNAECRSLKIILCTLFALWAPALAKADIPNQSPEQFLKGIYAPYTHGDGFEPLGKEGEKLFDHGLFLLIQRDALNSNGKNEVPLLNGDPLCNCQEYRELKNVKVTAPETGNPHPLASVSFTNSGKAETVQFELEPSGDTWKIYDITTSDIGSLRDYLSQGLAEKQP